MFEPHMFNAKVGTLSEARNSLLSVIHVRQQKLVFAQLFCNHVFGSSIKYINSGVTSEEPFITLSLGNEIIVRNLAL